MNKKIVIWIVKILGRNRCLTLIKIINRVLRKLVSSSHDIQMLIEWNVPPNPEWFDHNMDLYYQWHKTRNPLWVERGCFNLLAIKEKGNILELCCGDGFNAYHFYSIKAKRIISVDFDKRAIAHATENNKAENIDFIICDVREKMPEGEFDNILWDAAIEHFTEDEIFKIMKNIKGRLKKDGVLSGYTIVERVDGKKSQHQHEYEFKSKDDLIRFLSPYFKNIKVFETIYPSRHNLYFYASDQTLPFDKDWKFQAVRKEN